MNDTLNSMNISSLTAADLITAVGIFELCATVEGLNETDFHGMAHFIDRIIEAPLTTYKDANNDSLRIGSIILYSINQMMINSPENVSYLTGTNVALIGRPVDCNADNADLYGISDHGSSFGTTSNTNTITSISIDPTTACTANASRVFYSIYRNQKFFVGNSTHSSGLISGNSYIFRQPGKFDATTSSAVTDNKDCSIGFLETDGRVVSASTVAPGKSEFTVGEEFGGFFFIHKVIVDEEEQPLVNMKFSKEHVSKLCFQAGNTFPLFSVWNCSSWENENNMV